MNQLAVVEPINQDIVAGQKPTALVPQTFDQVFRMAQAISTARMAPSSLDTAEKVTIAIMHGLEVGFTPMMAVQSIAVVNGMPSIWGDGALGLCRSSGLMTNFEEWTEGEAEAEVAYCRVTRKDQKTPVTRTFSMAEAKKAGLTTKKGPWMAYPRRMLQMRARAFALRDAFADVLRGLHIAEEMQDVEEAKGLAGKLSVAAEEPAEGHDQQRINTVFKGPIEEAEVEEISEPEQVEEVEPEQQEQPEQQEAQGDQEQPEPKTDIGAELLSLLDQPTVGNCTKDQFGYLCLICDDFAKKGSEAEAKAHFKSELTNIRGFGDKKFEHLCHGALQARIWQIGQAENG